MKQKIAEVASIQFIAYALYDFFIILGYFMTIIFYGLQANDTDHDIKEILVQLSKDTIEIKTLCDNGKLWAKKDSDFNPDKPDTYIKRGNIHMFKKTRQGTLLNNKGESQNIDDYEDINDLVEHTTGDLAESLDSAVNRIDYKVETNQLKLFGIRLNTEFFAEIFFFTTSLVVGIIQQVADE